MSIVIRACVLLPVLAFGLAACKPGAGAAAALPETTNSIGITMVAIPAGRFTMGETNRADATGQWNSAYPAHDVTVQAFQIARTEVTVGQYKKYLMATGRDGQRELRSTDFMKYNTLDDEAPVINLRQYDIPRFIEWLNSVDGGGYRLPTEAEWEYACRAGGNDTYCGGNEIDSLAWYGDNSGGKAHPVGQKEPNAFGLHDMTGNAAEWVEDCWHSGYEDAPADGSAWATSDIECKHFVMRGGSWEYLPGGARATIRNYASPIWNERAVGFRLARSR